MLVDSSIILIWPMFALFDRHTVCLHGNLEVNPLQSAFIF